MKKFNLFFVVLVGVLCVVGNGYAQSTDCILSWSLGSEPDLYTYNIFTSRDNASWSLSSQLTGTAMNEVVTVKPATTIKCSEFSMSKIDYIGLWYFSLTATDLAGNESERSASVSKDFGTVVGTTAIVKTVTPDGLGANVTIEGDPIELEYSDDSTNGQWIKLNDFASGSLTYRHNKKWEVGTTFVCYRTHGTNGIWTEQGCNKVEVVIDIPPQAPENLRLE